MEMQKTFSTADLIKMLYAERSELTPENECPEYHEAETKLNNIYNQVDIILGEQHRKLNSDLCSSIWDMVVTAQYEFYRLGFLDACTIKEVGRNTESLTK